MKCLMSRKPKSGYRNRPEFLIPMSVIAVVRQLAQTGFGCPEAKGCAWTAMRRMTDLTSERFSVDHKFDSFANCKCKLDTCTVELSESEHRSGWKPLASVLGDAAAAFGCVNRVEELVKQFLRGAVAKLLARPSVQFISCSQDIKRMFKSQELCYSIGEAGRRFLR